MRIREQTPPAASRGATARVARCAARVLPPGFVVSPAEYNRPSGFALLCPITGKAKGYPYEVPLPEGLPIQGVVLSDRARSFDWRARQVQRICCAPASTVAEILGRIGTLVG